MDTRTAVIGGNITVNSTIMVVAVCPVAKNIIDSPIMGTSSITVSITWAIMSACLAYLSMPDLICRKNRRACSCRYAAVSVPPVLNEETYPSRKFRNAVLGCESARSISAAIGLLPRSVRLRIRAPSCFITGNTSAGERATMRSVENKDTLTDSMMLQAWQRARSPPLWRSACRRPLS